MTAHKKETFDKAEHTFTTYGGWTPSDVENALGAMYDAYTQTDAASRSNATRDAWITTRALVIISNLMNDPDLIHYDTDQLRKHRT